VANYSETLNGLYENPYEPRKTVAEAEKDLQDLLQQSFDGKGDGESAHDEVDMSQAVVEGFREGIRLLPHQVSGRVWMTDREKGKKLGGILADDMGLGKTIQTLARIVEGRPRKSDLEDGWVATTLWVRYLHYAFLTFDRLLESCAPLAWCPNGPPKFRKWPKI
jgi:SNF2 family DNA or RNA helicase